MGNEGDRAGIVFGISFTVSDFIPAFDHRIREINKGRLLRIGHKNTDKIVGVFPTLFEGLELLPAQNGFANKFLHHRNTDTPAGIQLTMVQQRTAQIRLSDGIGHKDRVLGSSTIQNLVGNPLQVGGVIG